ncbi:hypothetical protein GCM10018772_59700 [Streptomyces fumanus]|uniref:Uncharacterized protein n=1 Tax=Streptomyces fumanus TaxID=67302 RepID=A0A919AW49_9ACTN|nr:hypothetical protein GCM10018772_59700 [Streptomyces fumanus]
MPGERAGRVQVFHQPLERHVLVGVRGQVRLPHPLQQLGERRITTDIRTQHQRIDEEPDHALDRGLIAARHRRAERNVRARAHLGQQYRQRGLRHHEHRHAVPPRQLRQTRVHLGIRPHGDRTAPEGRHGRTRVVPGQGEFLG